MMTGLNTYYRILRSPTMDALIVAITVLVLSSQALAGQDEYPNLFRETAQLESIERPQHPAVKEYLALVENLPNDERWRERVDALYAPELYFSDTFLVARSRAQVAQHFANLREAGIALDMTVFDVLEGEHGVYLVWSAENRFTILGRDIEAASIGVTLFGFDEQGRINLQQDFWDSAQGFYQHVPVLGSAIRSIRKRFEG